MVTATTTTEEQLPASKITLQEAVEEYNRKRERTRRYKENTLTGEQVYYNQLARRLTRGGKSMQVQNITPEHVADWFYGKNGLHEVHCDTLGRKWQPITPATHNLIRRRIRVFNQWCIKRGYTTRDWLDEVPPLIEDENGETEHLQLTPRQLLDLLDSADNPRDRAYLAAAANTALRQSELKDRQRQHLDLDKGYLTVKIYKSRKSRKVPISQDLDKEMRDWIIYYEEQLGRQLKPDDYLFPNRVVVGFTFVKDPSLKAGGIPRPSKYDLVPEQMVPHTEHIVQKALKKLDPDIERHRQGTHTIRRSMALAIQIQGEGIHGYGTALRVTSRVLNHQFTQTTERYIGRNEAKQLAEEMIHGKPLLTAMVDDTNVIPIRRAEGL